MEISSAINLMKLKFDSKYAILIGNMSNYILMMLKTLFGDEDDALYESSSNASKPKSCASTLPLPPLHKAKSGFVGLENR